MRSIIRRLIAFLLLFVSTALVGFHVQPIQAATADAVWLLNQLNCLRQSVGAAPLTINPALTTSATNHSTYLANNAISNVHIEADGSTPRSRTLAAGYTGFIGENVVSGGTVQQGFSWWISDDIHYRNMTSLYWDEVGIGIASGPHGTWYTLDFGTSSWTAKRVPAAACGPYGKVVNTAVPNNQPINTQTGKSGKSGSKATIAPTPTPKPQLPSYVVGVDEHGNIKHKIQSGDTLGHIALIYSYDWNIIPVILSLNGITQDDFRKLQIGDIILIPPKNGTYTPTANQAAPPQTTNTAANTAANQTDSSTNGPVVTGIATTAATNTPAQTPTSAPPVNSLIQIPTYTLTPSNTPVPSDTPVPTNTLSLTQEAAITRTAVAMKITPPFQPTASVLSVNSNATEDSWLNGDTLRSLIPWAIALQFLLIGGFIVNAITSRHRPG